MAPHRIIIAAPSNLGLQPPAPGVEPGVKYLPERLLSLDFDSRSGITEIEEEMPPSYNPAIDPETKVRNADSIRTYTMKLGATVKIMLQSGRQSIVIGGDCSILLGCMVGLRSLGNYGLFFLDGHTDYMWPEHSSTGGAAGMDLALVTGNGPKQLTDIHEYSPYVKEEHVFCCGNREFEAAYVQLIKQSKINYYDLPSLREHGLAPTAVKFLHMVEEQGLDGFWIHLDADILDNQVMPSVDSPQPGGLTYSELRAVLLPLLSAPGCKGIDLTILDPTLDEDSVVSEAFVEHLSGILRDTAMAGL